MKAAVLHITAPVETKPLKLEEMDVPKISGYEILMKVKACGVCHSDVHIVEGEVFKGHKFPLVPGHEVVGVVEKIGENVREINSGDLVGIGWNYKSCLDCENCKNGLENLCGKKEGTGINRDGGYAEYMIADSRFVSKIPNRLKTEEAAPLFCAGLTAYRAVKLLSPKINQRVAVVGIGGLASYAIQFLKIYGAKVIALSRNEHHLKLAEKVGADETILLRDNYLSQKIEDSAAAAALNFAPSGKIIEEILIGLKRGGKLVNAGNIERTVAMDYRKALAGEKVLTTVSTGTRKDMREVLQLAAEGKIKSSVETMKLDNANEALIRVKSGSVEGRIVLIV